MKKDTDTYIGIFLIILVVLNILGFVRTIGITQRFIDIAVLLTGAYLVFK